MPALSIMVKPASGHCNMRCKYCFYHSVVSHRKQGQLGIMNEATADNLIQKALDFAGGDDVFLTFQGGEPLLAGLPYFEHFVAKVASLGGSRVHFSLQTNGTLIDDEWAQFFRKNNILIGVSLDGDREANKFRIMADGSPSFDNVINGIKLLDKYEVEYNILSVVTGYFADNVTRIYNYFKDEGFKFLQFIPCLRPIGSNDKSELFMTSGQCGEYLSKLFSMYAEDFLADRYISVRSMDNLVRTLAGMPPEQCGVSGVCSRQFVVEGNGNVYPCDFYCSDEWLLGNINNTDFRALFEDEKAKRFLKESYNIPYKCRECQYFKVCRGGGCKRERTSANYCAAYKQFFATNGDLFDKVLNKLKGIK